MSASRVVKIERKPIPGPDASLANILGMLISLKGTKQRELSARTGVPTSTLNKILKGNVDSPQVSTLVALSNFFGVTVGQLIGAEQLPLWIERVSSGIGNPSDIQWPEAHQQQANHRLIPVLTWDNIMPWLLKEDETLTPFEEEIIVGPDLNEKSFAVRIRDTMNGHFQKRSLLVFDPNQPSDPGCYVLVSENKKTPQLRTVIRDGENVYLKPLESFLTPSQLDSSKQIIGKLVEIRYRT